MVSTGSICKTDITMGNRSKWGPTVCQSRFGPNPTDLKTVTVITINTYYLTLVLN